MRAGAPVGTGGSYPPRGGSNSHARYEAKADPFGYG